MNAIFQVLRVSALLSLLSGCSAGEFFLANATNPIGRVDRHVDLAYGLQARQRLDVFAPPNSAHRRVVVFFYGGSWQSGSKNDYRFVAEALAKRGLVAVVPDYRLYPEVKFPAFDEDAARAVAWVQQHAGEFGGDAHDIVLMGHSAGAHTAAFLAYNHAFLRKFGADPRSISGLVGLSGPYVLVPDSDELRAAFSAPYTEKDWQPIGFVDPLAPPTLLLHGLADREVVPQETIRLSQALQAQRVRVEVHLYAHRGHAATLAPFAPLARWYTPEVISDVLQFVQSLAPG